MPAGTTTPSQRALAIVAICAVIASALAWLPLHDRFAQYFLGVPPPLAMSVLAIVGWVSLSALHAQGWLKETRGGFIVTTGLALAFAAIVIGADLLLRFPTSLNAPLPWALLFYPAMGFAAQSVLHLAPAAFAGEVLRRFGWTAAWPTILASSLPEAVLQAFSGGALALFTFVHVGAFGVGEFIVLQRYGYLQMYAMRLCYYLLWHIAWGAIRNAV